MTVKEAIDSDSLGLKPKNKERKEALDRENASHWQLILVYTFLCTAHILSLRTERYARIHTSQFIVRLPYFQHYDIDIFSQQLHSYVATFSTPRRREALHAEQEAKKKRKREIFFMLMET